MKAIRLRQPFGLERLEHADVPDPGAPDAGEIRVRLDASSLNAHDLAVVLGQLPTEDGRIALSDGAGVVEDVGAGVQEFAAGDHVVSTFFPKWLAGGPGPLAAGFATTPGDGIDGYACEVVVRPATAFTHAPRGWSHLEATTLTTAGLTAWRALMVAGCLKAGDSVLTLGTGGVSIFVLQLAKAAGATVIATSSSEDKLARAVALGADHAINYRQHPEWSGRHPVVDRSFALDDLSDAFRLQQAGGPFGKIGIGYSLAPAKAPR